jgi:DNA-binding transcriptional MerR regulator
MTNLSQEQIRDLSKSLETQHSAIRERNKKALEEELKPVEDQIRALYLSCAHPNNQRLNEGPFPRMRCPDCGYTKYI